MWHYFQIEGYGNLHIYGDLEAIKNDLKSRGWGIRGCASIIYWEN